jgi:hypothetical protein
MPGVIKEAVTSLDEIAEEIKKRLGPAEAVAGSA